jgi:hypothetical protein
MRRICVALVCVVLGMLAISAAAFASAYGGLGQAASLKPGEGGANGEVDPRSSRDFAVDPKTGDMFIADELHGAGKEFARLQELGPKGEFLAENRFKTGTGIEVGGVAVDSASHRVYLLINITREEESEAIQKKIENKETTLAAKEAELKKKEEKHEPVEELKAEIKTLEAEITKLEEELPVFDPGDLAAGELLSFSTEALSGKLKEQKVLAGSEVLKTNSEEPKGALLFPGGISVDPTNHDIVVLGEQDESVFKGPGEEDPRTAVQRIHENGTAGPRYVDTVNCLIGAEPSAGEPQCAAKPRPGEPPRSPIVTPTGTVYVELVQAAGELWEVPTTTEPSAGFKEVSVQPKRVFSLDDGSEQQKLVNFAGEEGVPNTMSFVPLSASEGRIYLAANLSQPGVASSLSGVVALNYVLQEGVATVTERGWTGGQEPTSAQTKCIVPAGSRPPLVAGTAGEKVLELDTSPANEKFSALVAVFGFGPGGEGCGHVAATPPAVEFGEKKNATEVPAGAATTLRSTLSGANAEGTSWTFKATTKGGLVEEGPFATGYQFESISFEHAFMHVGEYTILANVATDNLGTPEIKTETHLKVTLGPLSLKLVAHPTSVKKGEKVAFTATVTDPNTSTPHLTYKWNFGDGTPEAVEEESAASSTAVRKVEHAFSSNCGTGTCTVTLTVTDSEGAKSPAQIAPVKIEEPAPPGGGPPPGPPPSGGGAPPAEQHVLRETETHNPQATLSGTSLSVAANGTFPIKVTCPKGQSVCIGSITLRTLTAVSAKKRKAILTLATGSFTVSGGQVKTVTLRLSAKAKKLLAKSHTLRAKALLVAHDNSGASRTTSTTVTLKLVKPHKQH